jgi:hypothetical protein
MSDERWGHHTTALLHEWADAYDAAARAHAKMMQICLIGHVFLAAPAVVLPMIFPQVLTESETSQGFLACSIMAGLLSFGNLAGLSQRHRTSHHAYVALRTDLVTELARPVNARRPATLAVADFRSRGLQILSSSPSLPVHCSCCPWQLPPSTDFPKDPDVVRTLEELPPV